MDKRKKIPVQLQTTVTLTIDDVERICQALEFVMCLPDIDFEERSYFEGIYNELWNANFRSVR